MLTPNKNNIEVTSREVFRRELSEGLNPIRMLDQTPSLAIVPEGVHVALVVCPNE
jgi:hypothetical protein